MREKMMRVVELKQHGMTYPQICKEMGITESYAKQLMFDARKQGIVEPYVRPPKKERKYDHAGRPKGTPTPTIVETLVKTADGKQHIAKGYGNDKVLASIGDPKVSAFVQYHIDMTQMRIGCNKKDVDDLYNRFGKYLAYCVENGVLPGSMNCYYAIGITREDIYQWSSGRSDEAHRRFADDVKSFFASIHEQGATNGMMNPIFAMWLQKAHDNMIEASKVEAVDANPLGESQSAEEIVDKYAGVELPD